MVGLAVGDEETDVPTFDYPGFGGMRLGLGKEGGVEIGGFEGVRRGEADFGEDGAWFWLVEGERGGEVVGFVDVPAVAEGVNKDIGLTRASPADFFHAEGAEAVAGGGEVGGEEFEDGVAGVSGVEEEAEAPAGEFNAVA